MNILITAGGTVEAIDSVRYLANHATGRLGKQIAEKMSPECDTVFYIHGPNAVLPELSNILFFPISSVRDLEYTMKRLLTHESITAVIHSMAVSDYELDYTISEVDLAKKLAKTIHHTPDLNEATLTNLIAKELTQYNTSQTTAEKKIRSTSEQLIVVLGKAPKIIHQIKHWQPDTLLIGFKLLVDVPESELVENAKESIEKNQADFIVANDLTNINDNQHEAVLVSRKGIEKNFFTKEDIANGLMEVILERKKKHA